MKTIVQQIIDYCDEKILEIEQIPEDDNDDIESFGTGAYQDVKIHIQSLLPKEKEQLKSAWIEGSYLIASGKKNTISKDGKENKSFNDYYKQTYGTS